MILTLFIQNLRYLSYYVIDTLLVMQYFKDLQTGEFLSYFVIERTELKYLTFFTDKHKKRIFAVFSCKNKILQYCIMPLMVCYSVNF